MRRVAVSLLGGLLLCVSVLSGQSVDTQVVRVTTRLVQVNVIVHDRQGRPVIGLTKDDFTILDNGKLQPVRFFSMEANKVEAPGSPLPVDVYTNRMEQRGGVPTALTAVLFDEIGRASCRERV